MYLQSPHPVSSKMPVNQIEYQEFNLTIGFEGRDEGKNRFKKLGCGRGKIRREKGIGLFFKELALFIPYQHIDFDITGFYHDWKGFH